MSEKGRGLRTRMEKQAMKKRAFLISALIAGGVAAVAGAGFARMHGSGGMGMMEPGSMMGMGRGGCSMMGMMKTEDSGTPFVQGRLAFIKAELAITEAQQGAWTTYAEALKKNFESMQGMRQTMHAAMTAKTPLERLDAHIAAMESRLKALKEVKPTLAGLYETLSGE